MFLILLIVNFAIALTTAATVATLFNKPIAAILSRIVVEELSKAWQRYITFAIFVVGVSGGVRIWDLEKYVTPHEKDQPIIVLTPDRWALEVYRTVIETLQSTAWMLLVVFMVALIAVVIVRGQEMKYGKQSESEAR